MPGSKLISRPLRVESVAEHPFATLELPAAAYNRYNKRLRGLPGKEVDVFSSQFPTTAPLWGFDYAYVPGNVQWLGQQGCQFVCRYDKILPNPIAFTDSEALSYLDAGIYLVENWEEDGYSEVLGGYSSGVNRATLALAAHPNRPAGTAIYFSVDFDATSSQIGAVFSYFSGINSVLGPAGVKTGAYGSYSVIKYLFDRAVISYGWQTYAWSTVNGLLVWDSRAQLRQYLNGNQYDHDEAMVLDFGQWGYSAPQPAPNPPPPTPVSKIGEIDMDKFVVVAAGTTSADVTPGTWWIIDFTDPSNPTRSLVTGGQLPLVNILYSKQNLVYPGISCADIAPFAKK